LLEGGVFRSMQYVLAIKEMNQLMEKDSDTYDHSVRVASIAKVMAAWLKLDELRTHQLVTGCFLHDIGKLRIPLEVLTKTSALAPHEWDLMMLHSSIGAQIVSSYSHMEKEIIEVVEFHHERWNGKGYPKGLSGRDIPAHARICAIIDAFDCMISDRPYRQGLPVEEAKKQLLLHAGGQFDENYVNIFIQMLNQK
jgi:putative nucleotidyltransferase with HDIG domain